MGADGFHLVFFFSFNERARLGNEVRAELRSFFVRREEQCVENAMHLPSGRETKAVGIWGDNLGDLEGALSARGQFSGREVDLQVAGVKPYLCFYFPRGKLCSNPFFDCLSGFSVSGSSLFTSSIKEFKSFVKGREEHFPNRGVGSGLKAHHEREWCLVGDRMSGGVMRELSHRQEVRPFHRLTLAKDS